MDKKDRAFLHLLYDQGLNPVVIDPISSAFDADLNQPWWQGQLIETHAFDSSAANQFLAGIFYLGTITREKSPVALSTFPTFLNFVVPGTFNNVGGQDINYAYGAGIYHTHNRRPFSSAASL